MILPLFASFIIFIIWLAFHLHRREELEHKLQKAYWDKERRANSTRRKPLDDLAYITIPLEQLPMDTLKGDERADDIISRIQFLSGEKIVNFTGISNTDLKLAYGAPNITLLSAYDQNYTILARTLQEWGALLYDKGYKEEALIVLEFALSTGTDVAGTYRLLKTLYQERNTPEKLPMLFEQAQALHSASKNSILRLLEEA